MNIHPRAERQKFRRQWRAHARPGDLVGQLAGLVKKYNCYASPTNRTRDARSPIVGNDTQFRRPRFLRLFIHDLRTLGYRPQYLDNLSATHVQAVATFWVKRGLTVRTIQTRLAAVRMLFAWLDRANAMPGNKTLLPRDMRRQKTVATEDKGWGAHDLNVYAVARLCTGRDTWIGLALLLQRMFGLRMKESLLIRPHQADQTEKLLVAWGTKSGQKRFIPIETKVQRKLLKNCKVWAKPGKSLIGSRMAWRQARGRYYKVLRRDLLITRRWAGTSSHGLRCDYLNDVYEESAREASPVRGGRPVSPEIDRVARLEVARRAGHHRPGVASAYVGGVHRQRRPKAK